MADFNVMHDALLACDQEKLVSLVQSALSENVAPSTILNEGLIAGMDIVGEKMESGDMFIPEVLMAAQSMAACVEVLKPFLGESGASNMGSVVIGTVKGDLHDIGKNLVAMMMESAGMIVHNIGVDISPDDFVSQVKSKGAKILCLSALLTTTMPMMKKTIDALVEAGIRDTVKVLVGGAPVTQAFADEIGADGFAADAGSASRVAKSFIHY